MKALHWLFLSLFVGTVFQPQLASNGVDILTAPLLKVLSAPYGASDHHPKGN
jgi:hypothetical protein